MGGLHRELGVAPGEGAPRPGAHRGAEPLLGRVEVLDQDDDPGLQRLGH
jgi:hypothetical protein